MPGRRVLIQLSRTQAKAAWTDEQKQEQFLGILALISQETSLVHDVHRRHRRLRQHGVHGHLVVAGCGGQQRHGVSDVQRGFGAAAEFARDAGMAPEGDPAMLCNMNKWSGSAFSSVVNCRRSKFVVDL